jgi:hypothetical protein
MDLRFAHMHKQFHTASFDRSNHFPSVIVCSNALQHGFIHFNVSRSALRVSYIDAASGQSIDALTLNAQRFDRTPPFALIAFPQVNATAPQTTLTAAHTSNNPTSSLSSSFSPDLVIRVTFARARDFVRFCQFSAEISLKFQNNTWIAITVTIVGLLVVGALVAIVVLIVVRRKNRNEDKFDEEANEQLHDEEMTERRDEEVTTSSYDEKRVDEGVAEE